MSRSPEARLLGSKSQDCLPDPRSCVILGKQDHLSESVSSPTKWAYNRTNLKVL